MKNILIVLLISAIAIAERDPRCPEENPGDLAVHLPHDYECTKFYMCDTEGNRVVVDCDDGLHYNEEIQVKTISIRLQNFTFFYRLLCCYILIFRLVIGQKRVKNNV